MPVLGPTHPDIVGSGLHEPVENGVARKSEDVIDAVRLAPAHLPAGFLRRADKNG
jgi:hypothetical protein